jgi:excisionase family DNA binding protein
MRAGRAITVAPLAQRLTTQEAADLLGVSRPTLIKLLEDGKIPFEQPGRHRRIRLDDLLAYRDRRRKERSEILDELVVQTQALGLYDDEAPEAG